MRRLLSSALGGKGNKVLTNAACVHRVERDLQRDVLNSESILCVEDVENFLLLHFGRLEDSAWVEEKCERRREALAAKKVEISGWKGLSEAVEAEVGRLQRADRDRARVQAVIDRLVLRDGAIRKAGKAQ